MKVKNIFFEDSSSKGFFSDKLSEFSSFLAWPAILDIYSHGLLSSLCTNTVWLSETRVGIILLPFFPRKEEFEQNASEIIP